MTDSARQCASRTYVFLQTCLRQPGLGGEDVVAVGMVDGAGAGGNVQLAVDVGDVGGGGSPADKERRGDLRIGLAIRHQPEDIQLASRQAEAIGGGRIAAGD